jgi:citrate lyase alpha subunit
MAKEIEILIFDLEDNLIKRVIDVEQISFLLNSSDRKHPKRILINASNYCDYAPYSMNEFLQLISGTN